MTNNAYRKLCTEFDINYQYNEEFTKLVDSRDIIKKDSIYGNNYVSTENMKQARKDYKAMKKPWLKDYHEVDLFIEAMPFGGYNGDYTPYYEVIK